MAFAARLQTGRIKGRWMGTAVLACSLLATPGTKPAWADGSWQWLDQQGRRVYSDTPPPASVPERSIRQRPANAEIRAMPPSGPAQADQPAPVEPSSSVPPRAGAGDRQQNPPLYQRNDEALRDNCRRARAALQTLNSGLRLQVINDKGEQVAMDEAMRENEIRRMQQAEADNCVPERKGGRR